MTVLELIEKLEEIRKDILPSNIYRPPVSGSPVGSFARKGEHGVAVPAEPEEVL